MPRRPGGPWSVDRPDARNRPPAPYHVRAGSMRLPGERDPTDGADAVPGEPPCPAAGSGRGRARRVLGGQAPRAGPGGSGRHDPRPEPVTHEDAGAPGRHPAALAADRRAAQAQEGRPARGGRGQGPGQPNEHPQRGIDDADIVFVELEGYLDADGYSRTRLVPVFHSQMPDTVEPVRSIRPVDVPLLSPMDAIIGNTGARALDDRTYVKHYSQYLEAMLSYLATKGTGSYSIDPSRVVPVPGRRPTTTAPSSATPRCWPSRPSGSATGRRTCTSRSPPATRR